MTRISISTLCAVVVMAGTCASVAAEDPYRKPVVLVVQVGAAEEDIARENRFVTDLALDIDGFEIRKVSPPKALFVTLPLDRQIAELKPLMARNNAVAAMWLNALSKDVILLQVVVLDTGRALVRLFEKERGEGSEAALALTAGELLGTAYMFDIQDSSPKKPEIRELVKQTKRRAGISSRPRWHFGGMFDAGVDVLNVEGPRVRLGGVLGAERPIGDVVFIGFGAGGSYGPFGEAGEFTLKGYTIFGQLSLAAAFPIKQSRMGPFLAVRLGSANIVATHNAYPRDDFAFFTVVLAAGPEWRVPVAERLSLLFRVGVEGAPIRETVRRRSDDTLIFRSSYMSVGATAGLLF